MILLVLIRVEVIGNFSFRLAEISFLASLLLPLRFVDQVFIICFFFFFLEEERNWRKELWYVNVTWTFSLFLYFIQFVSLWRGKEE